RYYDLPCLGATASRQGSVLPAGSRPARRYEYPLAMGFPGEMCLRYVGGHTARTLTGIPGVLAFLETVPPGHPTVRIALYSARRIFAGLTLPALNAWRLTVSKAMNKAIKAASAKTTQLIDIR